MSSLGQGAAAYVQARINANRNISGVQGKSTYGKGVSSDAAKEITAILNQGNYGAYPRIATSIRNSAARGYAPRIITAEQRAKTIAKQQAPNVQLEQVLGAFTAAHPKIAGGDLGKMMTTMGWYVAPSGKIYNTDGKAISRKMRKEMRQGGKTSQWNSADESVRQAYNFAIAWNGFQRVAGTTERYLTDARSFVEAKAKRQAFVDTGIPYLQATARKVQKYGSIDAYINSLYVSAANLKTGQDKFSQRFQDNVNKRLSVLGRSGVSGQMFGSGTGGGGSYAPSAAAGGNLAQTMVIPERSTVMGMQSGITGGGLSQSVIDGLAAIANGDAAMFQTLVNAISK